MANDPKEPPKSPEKQGAPRGKRPRGGPGPWPPRIEPFMAPTTDLNPRDLKTWAKRTGFNPNFSGETASVSSDLESGSARWEAPRRPEIEAVPVVERVRPESLRDGVPEMRRHADLAPPPPPSTLAVVEPPPEPTNKVAPIGDGGGSKGPEKIEKEEAEVLGIDRPEFAAAGIPAYTRRPLVRKTSCLASLSFYSLQHYLSLAGSLVFVPLVLVPVMGGTDEETATVVSTVLLVTGIATLLHSYLGTRLPLVQGSSFVYLAPALAIANSREFRNLSENRFKHIMKELQGAIIVGSIFQCIFGYSGLMSLFLRFINPVTIAPTVAAVGLAFFGYAFPQAGTCIELSIPQLVLIIVFTLYLRRVSIYGHRIFQVYAVPLGVAITWVYASLLTASGAYNFKGCDPNIPTSNILYEACRKHAIIMKHCRTDVSDAWRTSAWFRIPYPFQWGLPTFRLRTCMIMVVVSVIASIDSVGSYHASSLLINSSAPTPGIVGRGIGLEGCTSILAGMWGTGTGSTTLTENVHTIGITKMGSRKAVEMGAVVLIVCSFMGKIGAVIASIPLAMAASVLCFMWAMVVALGLSTLRYTDGGSSRNVLIVGLSLFLSVSVPAYFQQYGATINLILPSYMSPYVALSDGPIHTGNKDFDFAVNGLLSLHMVVAFLVAFILDNTVPGSKQERGVYIWARASEVANDPNFVSEYALSSKIARCFRWVKWVGA
ncbi:Nucleobase-ascorbate transporter 11 [Nymphaea thermarum]|nr:Nucleobase-ascorbate transporter 11 [Nymphaea thermarum]